MADIGPTRKDRESQQTEAATHGQDDIFRLLTEHANDYFRVLDLAGRSVYASPAVGRLYGCAPATLFEFAHPEDMENCQRWWQKILAGEAGRIHWRVRDTGGRWLWMETLAVIARYKNSPHVLTICRDVTDRKRTELALQENERLVRQVLQALPIGVAVTNLSGDILINNPAFEQIWGGIIASGAERYATSKGWWHDTGNCIEPGEWASVRAFTRGQTSVNELIDIETFDGVRKVIKNSGAPIRDDDGTITGAVVINEDITDVLHLEDQLRQAQKMQAVGQLAGGVAHDFNNLLTIISGYSEILLPSLPPTDPRREMILQIHEAGQRAASLTRQLLAFSRRTVLEPKILDLNEVVRENEKMLNRLIGEDVQLTATLAPNIPAVKVDPGQVSQVIMNLAVNARDAMPTGGKLSVETANVEMDQVAVAMNPEARPGRYVMLAVTDTGIGMTPEVQGHLFEPFFTTKEPGKGTGLGLATVYGIIKQSGGFISVYSEPGRGTAFKIYFPAAQDPVPTGRSFQGTMPVALGTETILVVEDEDAVRAMIRIVLQDAGDTVLEASRGGEAIQVAGAHQEPLHLLITDVVMPEMGGRELVERLTGIRPDLKVLYLSGYTDDAVVRHGVLQAEVAFLQKPFTLAALTAKVRQVLDDAGQS